MINRFDKEQSQLEEDYEAGLITYDELVKLSREIDMEEADYYLREMAYMSSRY